MGTRAAQAGDVVFSGDGRFAGALRALLPDHLRRARPALVTLVILQLVQTVALLYLPRLSADIIDKGVVAGDVSYILRRGGLMVAVTVLQIVALLVVVRYGARVATDVGHDLRVALFERVQSFSARELGRFGVPSLVTRTTNDVQQVQALVLAILTMFVSTPAMAVGGVLLALGQDAPLSLVLLVMIPVLVVTLSWIIRRVTPLFRRMQRQVDAVNRILREQVTGARVIRAFTREEYERRRFAEANGELADISVRSGRLTAMMLPLAATIVNVFSVPVVWVSAYRIDAGGMEIGAVIAFLGYLTLILVAVITGAFTLMMVPRAEVGAERIGEVLWTPAGLQFPASPVRHLPQPGHLDMEGVGFSYPGAQAPVLVGVDLFARPGRTTAVIGSTGSGKSTLLALVTRHADATAGRVLVGGVDVRDMDPAVLAETVGFVPQAPLLFAGTVADNLRYGDPHASAERMWHALEVAQAAGFVAELDGGLQAVLSQGGRNLSGGQRQRLAIARALVGHRRVYLFDDAFSALDHATESRLRTALATELAEATVVMVAQRVDTIRDADQIVVLDAGTVVGVGRHEELLETSPVYREIVNSQNLQEATA